MCLLKSIAFWCFPAIGILLCAMVIFGQTLSLSLWIFKIREISFWKKVSGGILSFCVSLVIWLLLRAAIVAMEYYVRSYQLLEGIQKYYIYSYAPILIVFILQPVIYHFFMVCFLKIDKKRAIAPALLTGVFNIALTILTIVFIFLAFLSLGDPAPRQIQ